MEYCFTINFDLLETAKLISPWLLAIAVYWVWHSQKKKEVLAKFAYELILKDINLHNEMSKKEEIDIEKRYDIVKDYYNNIKLFTYLINNENQKIILNNLYNEYIELGKQIKKKDYDLSKIKIKYREIKDMNQDKYREILINYINFKFFVKSV
jgi:hypothetical protein